MPGWPPNGFELSWGPDTAGPSDRSATALVPRVLAPGMEIEQREVRIDAGGVTLAGTLFFPPGVSRPLSRRGPDRSSYR